MSCAVIVDDDPYILMPACDIFEEAGCRFHEAATGDEAKTLHADHADDVALLFSNVKMVGKTDGFAPGHHVADNRVWIEIVIANGNVKPDLGDMPDKATFISKPVNGRMLQHASQREAVGEQITRAAQAGDLN